MNKLKRLSITLYLLLLAVANGHPSGARTTADEAATTNCTQPSYRAIRNFHIGNAVQQMLAGDFNGDDQPDLALFGASSGVLLGDGAGRFSEGGLLALPVPLAQGVSGDFNGDAIPDLAGVGPREGGHQAALLLGDGTGKFDAAFTVALTAMPWAIVGGDFNDDGKLDLAVSSSPAKTLVILPGDGAGRFGQAIIINLADNPSFITAGDFNGDGRLDLAASSEIAGNVTIISNDGGERFTALAPWRVENGPYELTPGDFDRDGRLDLAVVNNNPRQLLIYRNQGTNQFMQTGSFNSTFYTRAVPTDLNRDGALDLLLTDENGTYLLRNNGAGGFTSATIEGMRYLSSAIAIEDFNLDGVLDLAFGGGKIYVALGESATRFLTAPDFFINAPSHFTAGTAQGDFNRDGNADIAVTHFPSGGSNTTGAVTIMLSDGAGNLRLVTKIDLGRTPRRVITQDFNQDGKLDLAVTLQGDNKVVVLLGDGTGFFGIHRSYDTARAPLALAAGDLNNDGRLDLAVNSPVDNVVSVMLGTEMGFATAQNYSAGTNPWGLVAGDFNGDGKLDLAISSGGLTRVSILLGNGAGGFSAATSFVAGVKIGMLAAADFNQDGKLDLAVNDEHPNFIIGMVKLFAGDGAGGFAAAGSYDIDDRPVNLAAADINNDARPDLIVSNQFATGATLLLNDGTGKFGAKSNYFVGGNTHTFALGDFNRDGRPDLAFNTPIGVTLILSACLATTELASTSAASYRTAKLATASIVAAFGQSLATTTAAAEALPLPTTLAGVSVNVTDSSGAERAAPLFFVAPGQVNYQLPPGTAEGAATVVIKNGGNTVANGRVQVAQVAPGLFAANASGHGLAAGITLRIKGDGTQLYEPTARFDAAQNGFVPVPIDLSNPAEQVFLLLFGTGLRNYSAPATVTARIGGAITEVLFAGTQGGFVGLDQVNLRLPSSLSGRGVVEIVLTVAGKTANVVQVGIK